MKMGENGKLERKMWRGRRETEREREEKGDKGKGTEGSCKRCVKEGKRGKDETKSKL